MLGTRRPSSLYSSKMALVVHHQHRHSSFGYSLKHVAVFCIWITVLLASTTTSLLLIVYQHDINNIHGGPAHWWISSRQAHQQQEQTRDKTNAPLLSSLLRRAKEGVYSPQQKSQNRLKEGKQEQDKQGILVTPVPAVAAARPIHFQWKCADQCSCLPPVRDDVVYMHHSYNVKNQTYWPKSWVVFRQSWLDHHVNDGWVFVFWLDKHNDLLARCTGYDALFQGRSFIQKADLSRLLYLFKYTGFYADMDYLALKSQVPLLNEHPLLKDVQILLQGRIDQVVGLEWGFARKRGHEFWTYCLDNHIVSVSNLLPAFISTGPHMLRRCLKRYIESHNTTPREQGRGTPIPHMHSFHNNSIAIVEPCLIAPVDGRDFESNCAPWRGRDDSAWLSSEWQTSACRHELVDEKDAFAVTFNTQSWKRTTRLQEVDND